MTSITFSFRYLMNYKAKLTTMCAAIIYFFLSKLHKTTGVMAPFEKKNTCGDLHKLVSAVMCVCVCVFSWKLAHKEN